MGNNGSIGERIRTVRGTKTQTEFAVCLGITQRAIVNYETGGRIPKGSILRKICEQYGIEEKWLLTGEGPMCQPRGAQPDFQSKMGDTSPILNAQSSQHADITENHKEKMGDVSPILRLTEQNAALQRDLLESIRQNGDLRVEVERQRARIIELERQLVEPQKLVAELKADVAQLNVENRELREKVRQFERMGLRLRHESDVLQNGLPGGDE